MKDMFQNDRGQAYAIEGLTAALLVIASVTYALNATAITPLSASTSNQEIQEQNRILADDILDLGASQHTLIPTILNYDPNKGKFKSASEEFYTRPPPTEFGDLLAATLSEQNYAVNIYIQFRENGEKKRVRLVYQGNPSENAAAATRTVLLYDRMEITGTDRDIEDVGAFYASDEFSNSDMFNVIQIKIVVWKM